MDPELRRPSCEQENPAGPGSGLKPGHPEAACRSEQTQTHIGLRLQYDTSYRLRMKKNTVMKETCEHSREKSFICRLPETERNVLSFNVLEFCRLIS